MEVTPGMRFDIEPYERAGPVAFGMPRDEVRRVLATPADAFRKAEDSREPSDDFPALGVVVFYRPPGRCQAVEFSGGGDAEPVVAGHTLLGRPYSEVHPWLADIDPDLRELVGTVVSLRLGVSLTAPGASADAGHPVATVMAFERGYYGDLLR